MASEILLSDWINDVKERTKKITCMRRPKRPFRSIDSRSPEESDALGNAVILNWNNALKSGALVKEADGSYRICTQKRR
ncbi:MAG: hypothetical protein ACRC76_15040 [Proteocatella sp.]